MLNKTKRTIYHRDRDKVNEDVPDSDCIQDSSGPAPGGRRQPGRISPPPRPVHPVPGNDSPGPGRPGPAAPSRGGLIRNFLEGPGGRPNPRRIAVAGEEPLQRSAPRGGTNALPSRWTGADRGGPGRISDNRLVSITGNRTGKLVVAWISIWYVEAELHSRRIEYTGFLRRRSCRFTPGRD